MQAASLPAASEPVHPLATGCLQQGWTRPETRIATQSRANRGNAGSNIDSGDGNGYCRQPVWWASRLGNHNLVIQYVGRGRELTDSGLRDARGSALSAAIIGRAPAHGVSPQPSELSCAVLGEPQGTNDSNAALLPPTSPGWMTASGRSDAPECRYAWPSKRRFGPPATVQPDRRGRDRPDQ